MVTWKCTRNQRRSLTNLLQEGNMTVQDYHITQNQVSHLDTEKSNDAQVPCYTYYFHSPGDMIDRFHVTSSFSKIQAKDFILIRHKRINFCLQFFSPIVYFVWKQTHFEFQGCSGAWHRATIAFIEKYILISWFLTFSEVKALEKVLL